MTEESKARSRGQAAPSQKHIPSLDGIRGLAILLVIFHHLRFLFEPVHRSQRILLKLADGGWSGVEIFFVLSGFLITGILLDTSNSTNYFLVFYARRVLRIFPLYFFYLAIVFVGLSWWQRQHLGISPWAGTSIWPYLLYVENLKHPTMFNDLFLGHLWSLAVEEQFYTIWPLFVAVMPRRLLGWSTLIISSVAIAYRFHYAGNGILSSFQLNTSTLASLDSLAIGALAAILIRSRRMKPYLPKIISVVGSISFVAIVLVCYREGSAFLYFKLVHVWGVLALSLGSACLILYCAMSEQALFVRLLSWQPLRTIGKVSYGLYVWHPLVIALVLPMTPKLQPGLAPWAQTLIKLAVMGFLTLVAYCLASLSWFALEKPVLKLKKFFSYNRLPVKTLYSVGSDEELSVLAK